ncbi:MAG: hypothetical protein R3C59_23745 [Planctomycetaceae bacterium]
MKINFSQEWLNWAAENEDGCSVGAGVNAIEASDSCQIRMPKESQRKEASPIFDRIRLCIRLLMAEWGKTVTRDALDGGLILMLNDSLRDALLTGAEISDENRGLGVVKGLDFVLQELEIAGTIHVDNEHMQQRIRLIKQCSDSVTDDDRKRLKEVREVFEHQRELGKVTETEDCLDVKLDLVSA